MAATGGAMMTFDPQARTWQKAGNLLQALEPRRQPGARADPLSWADAGGLYLFGGRGCFKYPASAATIDARVNALRAAQRDWQAVHHNHSTCVHLRPPRSTLSVKNMFQQPSYSCRML